MELQENIESSDIQLSLDGDIDSVFGDRQDTNFLNAGGVFKKIGKGIKKVAKSKVGKLGAAVATGGASVAASKKQRQQLAKDVKTAAKSKVGKAVINISTGGLGTKEGRKNLKKVAKAVKTLSLAPGRNSVEALIRLNIWGLASDLKKKKDAATKSPADQAAWDKVRNVWKKVGGNRTTFDKMIETGAKKKALKISFKKHKGADGSSIYESTIDSGEYFGPVQFAAMIAAAAPIIAAIVGALGKKPAGMDAESEANLQSESAELSGQFNQATEALAKSGELEKVAKAEQSGTDYEAQDIDPQTGQIIKTPKQKLQGGLPVWAWVGIGLGAAALITTIVVVSKK